MTWYAVIQGETGETLWPSGLIVVDTYDDQEDANDVAKRLSALEMRHYRVVKCEEISLFCAPHVKVIQGLGLNPMSPQELAEKRAEILEEKRIARAKKCGTQST